MGGGTLYHTTKDTNDFSPTLTAADTICFTKDGIREIA